uniref:Secreted protein n=1 Tax=Achlya hypogyna TaxID=1202772 RepID=A0A0A7CPN1_ACHHY|nr:secreted protein [Achlya hypogyna]
MWPRWLLSLAVLCAFTRSQSPCPAPNDTSTWSLLPSTDRRFEARDGHASAVFRGKLWVIGGKSGTYTTRRLVSTTRRSDIWTSVDGDVWTQIIDEAQFPRRFGHSLTVFTEKILGASILVLLGGYSPTPANDIWYSLDGGEMPPIAHCVPSPDLDTGELSRALGTAWVALCHCTQRPLLRHGRNPLNNDVWYTDSIVNGTSQGCLSPTQPLAGNWQAMGSVPWSARAGHACVVHTVKNATLGDASTKAMGVLAGGWGDDTKMLNDVWLLGDDRTCINCRSRDGAPEVWTLATEAAPWPVRAFSALVSLDAHTPSDYLFGPRMWLLGGGRTGHGIFPMFSYTDVWQSRDGGASCHKRAETSDTLVTWIPISSDALGKSTAGWCQVLVDGSSTCLGKWGHTVLKGAVLVASRTVPVVNVCGQNCRSESNVTNLNGSVIPQCDPRQAPSGATVRTTIVNGIYHMSSSFADGCGVCKTARYYPTTSLPALLFVGGSTSSDKVADVFQTTDFFLCEKNGNVCSNQGSCVAGGVCLCNALWGGEYCDELLPPSTARHVAPAIPVFLAAALLCVNYV